MKQKFFVTLAVKLPKIVLFKRDSSNVLFLFVCCKMCLLYGCTHTQTHTLKPTGTCVQHTDTETHAHVDTKQVSCRDRTLPEVVLDQEMLLGSVF